MFKSIHTPIASTRLSLLCNTLLFILKLIGGIIGRSQALVADALNSLLDIVANVIVWVGIKIARRPPDANHPYGHGNADNLAAVLVAIILFITGAYIGREALHSIINEDFQSPTYLATAVAAFTIIVKEILYRYTLKVGRKYKSPAVIANAYDHRSDVVVSLGTLVGIVVAQTRFPILDPIAGLWVAGFILKQGISIIIENYKTLMVASPGSNIERDLSSFITDLDGVAGVVWVKGRMVGSKYYMDTAVEVDGRITVREGHDIASRIGREVRAAFPDIADILIHIEPREK